VDFYEALGRRQMDVMIIIIRSKLTFNGKFSRPLAARAHNVHFSLLRKSVAEFAKGAAIRQGHLICCGQS
jgi:hypothetical protein